MMDITPFIPGDAVLFQPTLIGERRIAVGDQGGRLLDFSASVFIATPDQQKLIGLFYL